MIDQEKEQKVLAYIRSHKTHENTIDFISKAIGASRPTTRMVLATLEASGRIREIRIGNSKLFEVF